MARKSSAAVKIVHVKERALLVAAAVSPLRGSRPGSVDEQIERCAARRAGGRPEVAQVGGPSIAGAICEEAKRGCDLIMHGLGRRAVDRRAGRRAGGGRRALPRRDHEGAGPGGEYKRILVPVDGSVASRLAVELALRYAEARGPSWRWRC